MNKEILLIVDSISNEKNMEKEVIFHAIEVALEAITAKLYEEGVEISVVINRKSGDYETFRRWTVVKKEDDVEFPAKQIILQKAQEIDAELNVGDVVEEPIESIKFEFGRIAAQQARQIIMREIRLAERGDLMKKYQGMMGSLMSGVVKKVSREGVLLDMGDGTEGMVLKEEMIPKEAMHVNDRVKGVLYEVKSDRKGTFLYLSRIRPELLIELFKLEVPEVDEEVIEIKGVARDPGSRAKMMVKTNDGRIDPIGACIGMRGSRVLAVSNELGGERIDIILWDADPAQLVVNSMAPAEIASIVVDEENKKMDLVVREDQLAQAIGRNGQNVRLAGELSGWKLNVVTTAEAEKKNKAATENQLVLFTKELDVDAEIAEILAQEGFHSLEDVAYAPLTDLAEIDGFDQEIAEVLQNRARNVLLEQALTSKDSVSAKVEPAKDLLELEGMTRHLAYIFASRGIITQEDLAEQSVDDLIDIEELSEEKAAELIMTARKPWFE